MHDCKIKRCNYNCKKLKNWKTTAAQLSSKFEKFNEII